jgi:hypothetical protein
MSSSTGVWSRFTRPVLVAAATVLAVILVLLAVFYIGGAIFGLVALWVMPANAAGQAGGYLPALTSITG